MLRAAASVAALCAAFVVVMYFAYSGDTVPTPDQTATPSSLVAQASGTTSPDVSELPDILEGVEVRELEVGPPWDLPSDIALILETGCYGCSGGPSGLVRVFVRPDGSIVHEPLINQEELGIPPQLNTAPDGTVYEFQAALTGYAIRPDGSRIVAGLCARERCGRGGIDDWSANSQTAIFSSSDGGISWTEIGRLDVGARVVAMFPDDRILLATFPEQLTTTFRTFPDLAILEPPGPEYDWGADVLPNGELIWYSDDRTWVSPDGRPLLTFPPVEPASLHDFLIEPKEMHGLAIIYSSAGSRGANYLVPFDSSGAIGRGTFARAGDSVVWSRGPVEIGVELTKEGLILGNASVATDEISPNGVPLVFDHDPVVIDLESGTMRVLRAFISYYGSGRNIVVAIQRGPFARVVNTDNTCLHIRETGNTPDSPSLDCAAEGVLLRDLGQQVGDWRLVATPAGIEGWVHVDYLER